MRLARVGASSTVATGYDSVGQGFEVHPDGERTITRREAARLQTLPDIFALDVIIAKPTRWAMAIDNAVPPPGMREMVKGLVGGMGCSGR